MAHNVDAVRKKVQSILTSRFGSVTVDDEDRFSFAHESARIFVRLLDQEERVVISLEAPLLFEVPASPELFEHVALTADDYLFGHLSAVKDEDGVLIMFTHRLLGDYLDEEELFGAVIAVLGSGNDLDDVLQQRFGGKRFSDLS